MIRILFGAAALLLSVVAARAESATFRFNGVCNGKDMWNAWTITGHRNSPDALLRPWEPFAVDVDGYELVRLQQPTWSPKQYFLNQFSSWFMLGTTIGQTDALLWMGPGETRSTATNRSQRLPSTADMTPTQPGVDPQGQPYVAGHLYAMHGQCYGGVGVTLLLTMYYRKISSN